MSVFFADSSEPCEILRKNANHACMNEQFFLEFHMARSNIEMQRSGIEMGSSELCEKSKFYFQKKSGIYLKKSKEKVRKQKTKCDTIELTWEN